MALFWLILAVQRALLCLEDVRTFQLYLCYPVPLVKHFRYFPDTAQSRRPSKKSAPWVWDVDPCLFFQSLRLSLWCCGKRFKAAMRCACSATQSDWYSHTKLSVRSGQQSWCATRLCNYAKTQILCNAIFYRHEKIEENLFFKLH